VARLEAESWPVRGIESAASLAGRPDAFLLSWAEGVLREALSRSSLLDARPYEIFGQGSRVNDTYIEPTSDIDLVLMLKSPFVSNLEAPGQAGGYDWEQFRDDVLAVLGESYVVRMGRRCVNVDDPDSLFGEMVDILVATEYRRYSAPGSAEYEQGVFFRDREGRPIVNFPKQHRRRGDEKNLRTGGRFKETVRTVKRLRRRAEREGVLAEGAAPSYLLECLLFNVPDQVYRAAQPGKVRREALAWLSRTHREDPGLFAQLPCQNGINRLFGAGPDQWEPGAAGRIIDVLHQI
jgi:hypothetical protein